MEWYDNTEREVHLKNPNGGHKATQLKTHGEQGTKEMSGSNTFLPINFPLIPVSPMTPSKCILSLFPHCIISCGGNIPERLDCVGPQSSSRTSPVHIVLSSVLLLTMNSADGSLFELAAPCLDPLGLLDSPWASPSLLFETMLPLRFDWPTISESGLLVMAVPLSCSLLALPPLDLALLALDFLDLPSLQSGVFSCRGGVLLGWGGVTGSCGWTAGGFILGTGVVGFVCGTEWLSVKTSVRLSSSVCSLAKFTKTCKNEMLFRDFFIYLTFGNELFLMNLFHCILPQSQIIRDNIRPFASWILSGKENKSTATNCTRESNYFFLPSPGRVWSVTQRSQGFPAPRSCWPARQIREPGSSCVMEAGTAARSRGVPSTRCWERTWPYSRWWDSLDVIYCRPGEG